MLAPAALAPLLAAVAACPLALLWWRERSRRAAAEAAGRRARRLASLAERANDVLILCDAAGRIVEVNARAEAVYGWSREELTGMELAALRAPSERAGLADVLSRAVHGARGTYETVHLRRDGTELPVEVSASAVKLDGETWGFAIVRDATERKRVEAALRESEARFREAFHGASVGIALVDPAGAFVDWNEALEGMLGYGAEELARLRFQDLLLPEDRPGSVRAFAALVRGERDHNDMERRYVHKDGRVLQLRYRTAALRDEAGRLHRAIGIVEDVTQRRVAEEERRRIDAQLALADRMASLGTLAAGVAHELNNPLSYVVANVEVARGLVAGIAAEAAGDPRLEGPVREVSEALEDASVGAEQVRRIVGDVKALSSPGEGADAELVDVRAVLQSSANLARRLVTARARLDLELAEIPCVEGNAARLGQVFLNLLVNAAQALPPDGADLHRVRAGCGVGADGRVVVEVQDTGSGIPTALLARIFDPFFTTKPRGVGTGLGLAICQTIVAAHGGEIRVETAEGRGSTFRVLLPAAARPCPEARAAAAACDGRRGRVLLVDDEPYVLRTMERILAPGHEVVLAATAAEALARVAEGPPFHAVLCDVMMPGMNGMELFRELARRGDGVSERVVFVTGGALLDDVRAFLDRAGAPVIEKPFAPAQLLAAVERLVAIG